MIKKAKQNSIDVWLLLKININYTIINNANIAIIKLISVPTKYFSANFFSSNCLNLARDFAVKTKAIEPYKLSIPKSKITTLSSIPINAPALSDSFFS